MSPHRNDPAWLIEWRYERARRARDAWFEHQVFILSFCCLILSLCAAAIELGH